ncbi:tetratricopeptide repeat protein [Occultella gossypii]|uniref:Tetratricopeptide repeat protein n=1 Tax=Occultella gossypii TaxID=2800820 RepID=A0ABS7SK35_9MICO|nr:hypothetical protein [Occultella gossypii]MBZ2199721.1 hypothetical protein [Occultella gossypii]
MNGAVGPVGPDDGPGERDVDLVERDDDLAWELFDVQPTHPEVGRIATRVLAQEPWRNETRRLLAMHRMACGELDEAREILLAVIGARDSVFVDAAEALYELEKYASNYDEARRWAETAVRAGPESWANQMRLGAATAMAGDPELGWHLLDDAVARCARTDPDELTSALAERTIAHFESVAPAERVIPAAEEAVRADPSNEYVSTALVWAHVHAGRYDDAEDVSLGLLRLDPTNAPARNAVSMIRMMRTKAKEQGITFAEIHESGMVRLAWTERRERMLGIDLPAALTALDDVLPDELRAALRPGLGDAARGSSMGDQELTAWHDGQEPGTGALWRDGGGFRLLSSAEIAALDEAIEADPGAYPEWKHERLADDYAQVMTDDHGGYLVATYRGVIVRRSGADDVLVSPTLADCFWDRVAAFGGRDPRPVPRNIDDPEADVQ